MSPGTWTLLLLTAAAAAFLLPLSPALIEWYRKTDTAPLQVVREQDTNIRHFAQSFRNQVGAIFEEHRITASGAREPFEGVWKGSDRFYYTGPLRHAPLTGEELRAHLCHRLLLSAGKLVLPDHMVFEQEIYAGGDLDTGRRNTLRAVYSGRRLSLGEHTTIARWGHACGPVRAAANCRLFGRFSSDTLIALDPGVRFERLNAPSIQTGETLPATGGTPPQPSIPWSIPAGAMDLDAATALFTAAVKVEDHCAVDRSLVSRRSLRIGSGCAVSGSLKAHGKIHIGAGTIVDGAVVSRGPLYLAAGCRIGGPVISEDSIVIESGCVVGSESRPATVSAPRILLQTGCRIVGSIWAGRTGEVIAAD